MISNSGANSTLGIHNISNASDEAIVIKSSSGGITLEGSNSNTNISINNSPLVLSSISQPESTFNKLYNLTGDLYWNGSMLSGGGGSSTSLSNITTGTNTAILTTTPFPSTSNAIVIKTADNSSNFLDTIGIHNITSNSSEAIMIQSSNGGITLYGGNNSNIDIRNSPLYLEPISWPSNTDNKLWSYFYNNSSLYWGYNIIADINGASVRLDQIKEPYYETNISSYYKINLTSSDSYNGSNAISFVSNGSSGEETIGIYNYHGTSNEAIVLNSNAGGITLRSNVGNVYVTSGTPEISNFVLTHEGNMGFGKLYPEKKIHVYGSDNSIRLEDTSNNKWDIKIDSTNLKLYYIMLKKVLFQIQMEHTLIHQIKD